jgi:hypothetical protein
MDRKKKLAAALAAVRTYIQTEEEALLTPPAAPAAVAAQPAVPQGLWGASGRQSMMQTRSLMQLKTFHRR